MPRKRRKLDRTVLVVDDDRSLRGTLGRYLGRTCFVLEAGSCAEAFRVLEEKSVNVILVDVGLPDGQGFELADKATSLQPSPGIIIMTGDNSMDHAISALHHGASDFLLKPFSFEALEAAMERVHPQRRKRTGASLGADDNLDEWRERFAPDLLGADPALSRALGVIKRVAGTDVSVLVTGESGTGKELFARALRDAGSGTDAPFVPVNCAAIPEALLESELFGHVRGAFTGATQDREGRFKAADGGTLFLDEIGELPLPLQAKILRVLQEKIVTPIGSSKSEKVQVRVVAATNRDLEEMVEMGKFREDLLYRLNVIPVELPALRERRGDIPDLVEHFIVRANQRRNRTIEGITDATVNRMIAYDWPGNIRQLENTIERMVVLKSEGILDIGDLPRKIRMVDTISFPLLTMPILPPDGLELQRAVERFEEALIVQALERTGWNKNRAARLLRMNRTTLVEKLKKRNLTKPEKPASDKKAASKRP